MTGVIERFESFECKSGPGPYGRTYLAILKLKGDPASYPVEVVVSETVRGSRPGGALSEGDWDAVVRVKLDRLASATRGDWIPGVTLRAAIDYRELEDLLAEAKIEGLIEG
jgi:hypothetical protein